MDIRRWEETGDYFQWRGQSVFYQEGGEGEVIFLIHGFPTSSWEYNLLWENLTSQYRVIAADFMGFGFSGKPKDYQYGTQERTEMIYAIADLLGIPSFHILARSFGVYVAQQCMKDNLEDRSPVDVKSYCLLNGAIFTAQTEIPFRQKMMLSPLGGWWVKTFGKALFRSFFRTRSGKYSKIDSQLIRDLFQQILYNDGLSLIPKLNRYILEREKEHPSWESAMINCGVPIQLIWGIDKEDQIGGIKAAHAYRDKVGKQYVVMLKDIGHFPHLECPDKVLEFYTSFLKGII